MRGIDLSGPPTKRSVLSEAWFSYRMRWKRRRLILRSLRKRSELSRASVKSIPSEGILVFATLRNEMLRLEHWLGHYRAMGVSHFLIVDNASEDGTASFLAEQPDVSLWTTTDSYKGSRFGVDWLTCLQFKFGHNRWCLTVDADELLVYPSHPSRSLVDLTAHLDQVGHRAMGALMLDLYPRGSVSGAEYTSGDDPTRTLKWFDAGPYRGRWHPAFGNLWIQGGVRERMFFASEPERSPTLNKTPLVKWNRRWVYVTSTHQMLPRHVNRVFEPDRVTGVLLHTKFLPNISEKSAEEMQRKQHFENSELYQSYYESLVESPDLWHDGSTEYFGPDQLEDLGLMQRGEWAI